MAIPRERLPHLTIALIALVLTVVSSNLNWGGSNWRSIVEADARGYNAYLPAIFIHHDLNLGFFDAIEREKYANEDLFYDYRATAHGRTINKYFAGTALCQLPFFLIAHGWTLAAGGDADGFSRPYAIAVNVAALCWLVAGLLFLDRWLRELDIGPVDRSLTLILMVFGTNLFYYTVGEPGMSHVYSLAWVALFCLATHRWFEHRRGRSLVVAAFAVGMLVLIRPVNGLVLLAWPFLAGDRGRFLEGISGMFLHTRSFLLALVAGLAPPLLQLVLYKLSTGHFLVDAYGEEGFRFTDPHPVDILFSYKKGLFLYTPLYLLSLAGLWPLWKRSRFTAWAWVLFFAVVVWVLSSWWMWYYGGSFSGRVFVEYLPFFMVLLAFALKASRGTAWRRPLVFVCMALLVLCQVQTYQYRYYQIHWSDMDRQQYWDVFLRVDRLG